MAKIKCIKARQIFDSRGNTTVEAHVTLDDRTSARAVVPSAAFAGIHDHEAIQPIHNVFQAVGYVNKIIAPALAGMDPTKQATIDNFMVQKLDGAVNEWGWCKQKLGANAILAVSLAVCKAGAAVKRIPLYKHIADLAGNSTLVLPVPAFKIVNEGSHAGNKLAMQVRSLLQELRILPVEASSFEEAMKMGVEVYHQLKVVIKQKSIQAATQCSEAGGFIKEKEVALGLLKKAIEKADYTGKVLIGMDAAASEFCGQDKTYDMNFREENNDGTQRIPGDALGNVYSSFAVDYDVVSIENAFDRADLKHYAMMTAKFGEHIQIVGGDLWGNKLEKAINEKTCNALLLKVDQMGSVMESIEAVKMSKAAGWGVMASCSSLGWQRSIADVFLPKLFCFSETEDAFIADLSVGLATGQIKTGAPCSLECQALYKRLLQIEKELGEEAVYAGADFRKPVEPTRQEKERTMVNKMYPRGNNKNPPPQRAHGRGRARGVMIRDVQQDTSTANQTLTPTLWTEGPEETPNASEQQESEGTKMQTPESQRLAEVGQRAETGQSSGAIENPDKQDSWVFDEQGRRRIEPLGDSFNRATTGGDGSGNCEQGMDETTQLLQTDQTKMWFSASSSVKKTSKIYGWGSLARDFARSVGASTSHSARCKADRQDSATSEEVSKLKSELAQRDDQLAELRQTVGGMEKIIAAMLSRLDRLVSSEPGGAANEQVHDQDPPAPGDKDAEENGEEQDSSDDAANIGGDM